MRRTLTITLAVLAASIAACVASMLALNDSVDRAQALRSQAVLAMEEGEDDRAADLMVALAELWRSRNNLLEMLASHDALHEVQSAIAEAQICLECDDHDDFLRTMSVIGEGLEHIRDEEALRLSNLY